MGRGGSNFPTVMAMQINESCRYLRSILKGRSYKYAKKLHHRQKRREAKNINNPTPQYNRYTDGWVL